MHQYMATVRSGELEINKDLGDKHGSKKAKNR